MKVYGLRPKCIKKLNRKGFATKAAQQNNVVITILLTVNEKEDKTDKCIEELNEDALLNLM